ncbi:hypothetical protein B0T16DRAFT_140054 [Cercophora newfieldiana]|uniref:Uncharacterized protein n=1 Tax=Cercophora newfieldiana TaxID=92897 RepID=A0AA40CQ22_9PEZI|nr:hypothetical protein B0T16DRAFT_140054 [Cercophora newfieldiana]
MRNWTSNTGGWGWRIAVEEGRSTGHFHNTTLVSRHSTTTEKGTTDGGPLSPSRVISQASSKEARHPSRREFCTMSFPHPALVGGMSQLRLMLSLQLAPQPTTTTTNRELAVESIDATMPAARNYSSRSGMSRDTSMQFTIDTSLSAPGVANRWGVDLTTSRDTRTSTARAIDGLLINEEEEGEGREPPEMGACLQADDDDDGNQAIFSHMGRDIRLTASCWGPEESLRGKRRSPVPYVFSMVRGTEVKTSSLTVFELPSMIHVVRLGLQPFLASDRVWDVP